MRAINPSLDASQYTAFKKYVNDVNSCPAGRSDKKVEGEQMPFTTTPVN